MQGPFLRNALTDSGENRLQTGLYHVQPITRPYPPRDFHLMIGLLRRQEQFVLSTCVDQNLLDFL